MSTTPYDVKVNRALNPQIDLQNDPHHCSVDPAALRSMGLEVGQQIRLTAGGHRALFTVSEARDESDDKVLRMGLGGRQRLGNDGTFQATLDIEVTRNIPSDVDAKHQSEFVERLDETDSIHHGLVLCAPHGGMIEQYTDAQAEKVYAILQQAGKSVSCWRCKGWSADDGAWKSWHITSDEISPRSFSLLKRISGRAYRYALAFHGYDKQGVITIGGNGPADLKCAIRQALGGIKGLNCQIHIAEPGEDCSGQSSRNLVNWLTANGRGGIQIEQPLDVRKDYTDAIAIAVSAVYERLP